MRISIRLAAEEAASAVRVAFHTAAKQAAVTEGFFHLYEVDVVSQLPDPSDASRSAQLIVAALDKERDADVRWCLAAGIASVVVYMKPDDAARICGPTLPHLATALVRKGDCNFGVGQTVIQKGLRVLSSHNPDHVSQAAGIMAKALAMAESNASRRGELLGGLEASRTEFPVRRLPKRFGYFYLSWRKSMTTLFTIVYAVSGQMRVPVDRCRSFQTLGPTCPNGNRYFQKSAKSIHAQ